MQKPIEQLELDRIPDLLKEIPDPPSSLRLQGTLPDYEKRWLTVVGSRDATPYGREACQSLIEGLRGYPVVIVSGLAIGIDAVAHRAALSAKLLTVAVPGSGLNERVLYPAANRGLARDILEAGGALLSEYPDDFRAAQWTFPKRNRIMVGLSHAVLIIEAKRRSGTLITARLATEYNRDVFTVPGSIFSQNSEGPHMLLRLGATPVTTSADILDALGIEPLTDSIGHDLLLLSPQEEEIVALLSAPMSRDDLIRQLGKPVHEVNMLLATLELKGIVKEQYGELRLNVS